VTGAPDAPPSEGGKAPPTDGGSGGDGRRLSGYAGRKGQLPTWPRVALVAALFLFTFFVAKSCQEEQVRLSQDDAVALAEGQVDFEPEDAQVRLLRQGLDRRPVWVVSLSIPVAGDENPDPDAFKRLALVRIDATDGSVESVEEQQTATSPGRGEEQQAQP
jgi:hypothetical protein